MLDGMSPLSLSVCSVVFDRNGLFKIITEYMDGRPFHSWTDAYQILCSSHFFMLQLKPNVEVTKKTLNLAAEDGRLDVVQWIYINHPQVVDEAAIQPFENAASEGHLNVVKYIMCNESSKVVSITRALNYAAANGSTEVVQYLHSYAKSNDVESAIALAHEFKQNDVVGWLESQTNVQNEIASPCLYSIKSTFVPVPSVPNARYCSVLKSFIQRLTAWSRRF